MTAKAGGGAAAVASSATSDSMVHANAGSSAPTTPASTRGAADSAPTIVGAAGDAAAVAGVDAPTVANRPAPPEPAPPATTRGDQVPPEDLQAPPPAPSPASKRIGRRDPFEGRNVIGQYVIRRRLGEGGMGAVYLAEQPAMGRNAVIKVLHPHLSQTPQFADRFHLEARALSRLQHPNVVTIYNYGDMGDGTLFLAMEYLEGEDLSDVLRKKKRLDPERAVHVGVQVADALAEAHQAGIVHRDLKPSNIMLFRRGDRADVVKVLDFGVARLEGQALTATGDAWGTPRYMSPEQLQAQRLDGRSDLYSLALVLYEALAGRTPFVSDTPAGYLLQHLEQAPPRIEEIARRAKVPAALEEVLQNALSKRREDRPADLRAFGSSLQAALDQPEVADATLVADATRGSKPASTPADTIREASRKLAKRRESSRAAAPVETPPRPSRSFSGRLRSVASALRRLLDASARGLSRIVRAGKRQVTRLARGLAGRSSRWNQRLRKLWPRRRSATRRLFDRLSGRRSRRLALNAPLKRLRGLGRGRRKKKK